MVRWSVRVVLAAENDLLEVASDPDDFQVRDRSWPRRTSPLPLTVAEEVRDRLRGSEIFDFVLGDLFFTHDQLHPQGTPLRLLSGRIARNFIRVVLCD